MYLHAWHRLTHAHDQVSPTVHVPACMAQSGFLPLAPVVRDARRALSAVSGTAGARREHQPHPHPPQFHHHRCQQGRRTVQLASQSARTGLPRNLNPLETKQAKNTCNNSANATQRKMRAKKDAVFPRINALLQLNAWLQFKRLASNQTNSNKLPLSNKRLGCFWGVHRYSFGPRKAMCSNDLIVFYY